MTQAEAFALAIGGDMLLWRTLKQRFATFDAAKAGFDTFIAARPDFAPKVVEDATPNKA